MFALIVGFVALLVAGCAAYFSVQGLAALYAGQFISVCIMAGALEIGKLVSASYLHRYWDKTSFLLKLLSERSADDMKKLSQYIATKGMEQGEFADNFFTTLIKDARTIKQKMEQNPKYMTKKQYGDNPIKNIWDLFQDYSKVELLNDLDPIRGKDLLMDRFNTFLSMIGKDEVESVEGYNCIN